MRIYVTKNGFWLENTFFPSNRALDQTPGICRLTGFHEKESRDWIPGKQILNRLENGPDGPYCFLKFGDGLLSEPIFP